MARFAALLAILSLLLLGVADVALNYSNRVQLADATRSAARADSIADVGTDSSCALRLAAPLPDATKAMLCSAKRRSHIDADRLAIKVLYQDATGHEITDLSRSTSAPASVVVCMAVAVRSATGLLDPLVDGHFLHSRDAVHTGTPRGGVFVPPGGEQPLTSGGTSDSWGFCTPDARGGVGSNRSSG